MLVRATLCRATGNADVDIEELRTFVEIAQAGGVSGAARRLGVSKSVVSRRLIRLEAELGAIRSVMQKNFHARGSATLARLEPEGQVMRMWEAMETYLNRRQPLIIIAGADYGQGSSRDWAAKGVRLAGVETVVAEGFERIHRTNLIGMGVLPLEFKPGTTRLTLGLDGTETFDVEGDLKPRADLTLVIHRKNGETVKVAVTSRLDTAEEVSVYEAGGVLQRFAQDFLAANR